MISEVDERDETSTRPEDSKTFLEGERWVAQMLEGRVGPNHVEALGFKRHFSTPVDHACDGLPVRLSR
jgi:hypothetical protein